jgi:hypothetical protein
MLSIVVVVLLCETFCQVVAPSVEALGGTLFRHRLASPEFLVGLTVAGDAEGFEVVPVVGEAFHLLERLRRLYGHPVMHVDGWGDVAFGHSCRLALADAPLTEWMLAEVGDAELAPSAVVE